jgi:hypothetical protein
MDSKIQIKDSKGKVHEIPCDSTRVFEVCLTNTTKGDKSYKLKLTWEYDESAHAKSYDKPKGMVLQ